MGTRASKISLVAVALEQCQVNPTRRELMKSLRKRRVTRDAIITKLGIGHNAVQEMIGSLRIGKFMQLKAITSEMLQRYQDEGDDFLLSIVTGDESWFHHFDLETKRQGMEWHHLDSPAKKKPKTMPSAKKITGTIFWDAEGCILIEFL